MDLMISIFFFVFAFICMVFALYEERDTNNVDTDEETKSDNLIVMLLGSSVVLFFVSMACMLNVTSGSYSVALDTMVYSRMSEYTPLAYVPLGFAMLGIILTASKAFQMIDRARNE